MTSPHAACARRDELPVFFTALTRLQHLMLGTAATYLQQGGASAPLRARLLACLPCPAP